MKTKEVKRIVKLGSRVGGRYFAKREMSLWEFLDLIDQVACDFVQPIEPQISGVNFVDKLFNTERYRRNQRNLQKQKDMDLLIHYKNLIGFELAEIIDSDKKVKKVLKKR
jgi:hypothetical protein